LLKDDKIQYEILKDDVAKKEKDTIVENNNLLNITEKDNNSSLNIIEKNNVAEDIDKLFKKKK
jgi:hypothetical protein